MSVPRPNIQLPHEAHGALQIIERLRAAGHEALLAGGCVRDLLLGLTPQDFDVATNAPPPRIAELFRPTRHVGAKFGVTLVHRDGRWIEVATFRTDGHYADGRRPTSVTFGDARDDALRRDFSINGMFFDPQRGEVVDYVDGCADLEARILRAIGDPAARFAEDHLRLLRAVRFAARLGFEIEPQTLAAIRDAASTLARVAPERVRDELERTLATATRDAALRLLIESGLLTHLWAGAAWNEAELAETRRVYSLLSATAGFELAFAVLVATRSGAQIEQIARRLAFSNEQRRNTLWLVANQAALDEPDRPALAELKRLLANPAFDLLRDWTLARYHALPDAMQRRQRLDARISAIAPKDIAPPPFVTGDDLAERGVPAGPRYKAILDVLYTQQLDEKLTSRTDALRVMEELLKSE